MRKQKFSTALSFAFLTSCFSLFSSAQASAAGEKEVKFRMEWIPSGMYAPFYLAQSKGFYQAQGIDMKMLNGNGSLAAIDEVNAGHADMGMASCGVLATAISKGREVVSVAQYMGKYSWAFFIPKDSGIKRISDLAGKSVVMSPNSSEAVLLPAVMESAGLKPGALRVIAVDPSQKIATYGRGQGDTVITTVAYGAPLVEDARASDILPWAEVGFVMPDYCMFTRKEFADQQPDLVKKVVSATIQGIDEAQKNPAEAVDATMKVNPFIKKEQTTAQWAQTTQFIHSAAAANCPIGWHVPEDWSAGLETLQMYAGLQGDIKDASKFYTNRFVPACQ
ncbi:MAG: ABC transporter substrate-binding protein [Gammaproteobacteria bacterium]